MKRLTILACALLLAGNTAVLAQDTGNQVIEGCRNFLSSGPRTTLRDASDAGSCYGTVSAAVMYSKLYKDEIVFCAPNGYTMGQAVRIVLAYLEKHPEELHMPFAILALRALHVSWPCSTK